MSTTTHIGPEDLDALPAGAGVYCFYGPHEELLYVGKSVNVRGRVQDHFRSPGDTTRKHRIYKNTTDITVHPTPGEFGATVLELHYIKTHQPILNIQAREKEERTIAVEQSADGYLYPALSETDEVTTDRFDELLAVFTSRKQARGRIEELAEEYELCTQRLQMGTSRSDGPCFDYQLGNCRGACVGEESPASYNERFREAFREYGVEAWPYDGAVEVVEDDGEDRLVFVIEDWCIQEGRERRDGSWAPVLDASPLTEQFNYDVYKRLAHFLLKQEAADVRVVSSGVME
jgi:hypothetical protein